MPTTNKLLEALNLAMSALPATATVAELLAASNTRPVDTTLRISGRVNGDDIRKRPKTTGLTARELRGRLQHLPPDAQLTLERNIDGSVLLVFDPSVWSSAGADEERWAREEGDADRMAAWIYQRGEDALDAGGQLEGLSRRARRCQLRIEALFRDLDQQDEAALERLLEGVLDRPLDVVVVRALQEIAPTCKVFERIRRHLGAVGVGLLIEKDLDSRLSREELQDRAWERAWSRQQEAL